MDKTNGCVGKSVKNGAFAMWTLIPENWYFAFQEGFYIDDVTRKNRKKLITSIKITLGKRKYTRSSFLRCWIQKSSPCLIKIIIFQSISHYVISKKLFLESFFGKKISTHVSSIKSDNRLGYGHKNQKWQLFSKYFGFFRLFPFHSTETLP